MNATLIHRFGGSVGGKAERNQAPETTEKIGADGTHFQERPPPMFHLANMAPGWSGQLPLLPELNRPVARLREFGGGFVPGSELAPPWERVLSV
jgi:hypothetical protein